MYCFFSANPRNYSRANNVLSINVFLKNISFTNLLALKLKIDIRKLNIKCLTNKKGGNYGTLKKKRLFACLGKFRK